MPMPACHFSSVWSALRIQTAKGEDGGTGWGHRSFSLSGWSIYCNQNNSHSLMWYPRSGCRLLARFHIPPIEQFSLSRFISPRASGKFHSLFWSVFNWCVSSCSCRGGPACGHRHPVSAECPAGPAGRVSLHSHREPNRCHWMDWYDQLVLDFCSV